ncbi:glycosyltransferase family 2 protein [Aliagarivorans marinus]|uniref:glycosyltransferase family 2 protein n=1 Tax=Aliagarivorans marinus TaxID=561965 RepID=UPI0004213F41|nr:glycosyltransferase family 2 protein [Aliagarivorans marinus]
MTHICICIPTYRRREGLERLLQSLLLQSPDSLWLHVVVADNDARQSALEVAAVYQESFVRRGNCVLEYLSVPQKGLSNVRNALLDKVSAAADYVYFVDDDEYLGDDTLRQMLICSERYDADIVLGAVQPKFSSELPGYLTNGGFYAQEFVREGERLTYCASNNTLIKAVWVKQLRFDPLFNALGGEDQDYFGRMLCQGAKIVGSNLARVYETVPASRGKVSWLCWRAFRKGNTLAIIDRRKGTPGACLWRVLASFKQLVMACGYTVLVMLHGRDSGLRAMLSLANMAGMLLGLVGYRYAAYA